MSGDLAGARVWVTRTAPGAERTAERLRSQGAEPIVAPLLIVEDVACGPAAPSALAVLVTSAHAARRLSSLAIARETRVLAVGAATAQAAREDGFSNVISADGDGPALAALARTALLRGEGRVLWVRGADVAFDLGADLRAAGFDVAEHVVYRATPVPDWPDDVLQALQNGAVTAILLYSPTAARQLAVLAAGGGLLQDIAIVAMSAAVAATLRTTRIGLCAVAAHPDEAHMLDALALVLRSR